MFENEAWYRYLDEPMRDLVDMAYYVYDREAMRNEGLHDYSFLVFPMAKAYEGFLKKYFVDIGLLTAKQAAGRHFRIGSSLSPDLPKRYRKKTWLVKKLGDYCAQSSNSKHHKLPQRLWRTWRECRNKLFHYFPGHSEFISLEEAWDKLSMLRVAMTDCIECQRQVSGPPRSGKKKRS